MLHIDKPARSKTLGDTLSNFNLSIPDKSVLRIEVLLSNEIIKIWKIIVSFTFYLI